MITPEFRTIPAPPRIVAISGLVFAVLFIVSVVLIRLAVDEDGQLINGGFLLDATNG